MSDDYPPQRDQPTEAHDFDETVRRPPAERAPQPGPMARRVLPPTQATSRPMFGGEEEPPEKSGLYVPWWGFALVILVVAGITCGLWGVVLLNRDSAASGDASPTPIFVVITASPTSGVPATVTPSILVTTPPPTGATATPTFPPNSGLAITVGSRIVVRGTEGTGLTVRQGPGTDYTFVFIANEGEQFNVMDGPRESTGYTWWYILDPNNPDRFGWAVSIYMQVVP